MNVDVLSAVLRGLSFVALLQAAGAATFLAVFDRELTLRREFIVALIRISGACALVLLASHYLLEAARMSGELSGVLDPELQKMVADSSLLLVFVLRVVGLIVLMTTMRVRGRHFLGASVGVLLIVLSFVFTGHTAQHAPRIALAALLVLHLLAVCFWFGSLVPLLAINRCAERDTVANLVERFSRLAVRVVPLLFVAGGLLIVFLFSTPRNFLEPYGLILVGKIVGFGVLMGLAALNRFRLGPALGVSAEAARSFTRAVAIEYVLIVAILMGTAALTTFYSPTKNGADAILTREFSDLADPKRAPFDLARTQPPQCLIMWPVFDGHIGPRRKYVDLADRRRG